MHPTLLLASQSPRRLALLAQIGVDVRVIKVSVPEELGATEKPGEYVRRLAEQKAAAGAKYNSNAPCLGADTIVVSGSEQVLEKPQNKNNFFAIMNELSGGSHQVYTAVSLCFGDQQDTELVKTDVYFRHISLSEMEAYWQTKEPLDKAGGYGIQGLGGAFVEKIVGSYSSVVGLPLMQTQKLLHKFKVKTWSYVDE